MQSIANCEPYSNMRTLGKLLEISNNNNKPAWASLHHKLESLRWHIYTGHVMSWLAPHGIGGVLFYFTRIQIFCQVFAILCCNLFQIFSLYSLATLCCNLFLCLLLQSSAAIFFQIFSLYSLAPSAAIFFLCFPMQPSAAIFSLLVVNLSEVSISLADGHNIFQNPVCRILFLSFTRVHH